MKHIIIGTAGHIDHGKTTLIKALTGRETDRLEEEKKRGISIELGFTYFDLPSGQRAGIIDVPGHERFIRNMLAGVAGMDIVLLVIAADESVMEQTKEHLEILRFTGIEKGIVVLTKSDTVDEDWIELVKEDIKEEIKGTFLEEASIIPVSSTRGDGIDILISEIDKIAEMLPNHNQEALPRYGVDRVFSISGFGTVVTGTLLKGVLKRGQDIMIYPSKKEGRIRNLQVHDSDTEKAYPGQRVAINIANLEVDDIDRGDLLTEVDGLLSTKVLDVYLETINLPFSLENKTRIRLYNGTDEALGRMVYLDRDVLKSQEKTYVQLRMEEDVSVQSGDPFILRLYSPLITIGGGNIVDTNPDYKKKNEDDFDKVKKLHLADKEESLLIRMENNKRDLPNSLELAQMTGVKKSQMEELILKLEKENKLIYFSPINLPISIEYAEVLKEELINEIEKYHEAYPLRIGGGKEYFRTRLFGEKKSRASEYILDYLIKEADLKEDKGIISLKSFENRLDKEQEILANKIINLAKESLMPIRSEDIDTDVEYLEELFRYLLHIEKLILIEEFFVSKKLYEKGIEKVLEEIKKKGSISVAETRDLLDTNRRIALALLTTMDSRKLTIREGDGRVLL